MDGIVENIVEGSDETLSVERMYMYPRRHVLLEISYNCCLACPFCYIPWLNHAELYGRPLDLSQWKDFFDEVFQKGGGRGSHRAAESRWRIRCR